MIVKEGNKYKVINSYGLTAYFDTYSEAVAFYQESIENCKNED